MVAAMAYFNVPITQAFSETDKKQEKLAQASTFSRQSTFITVV
jgi:hypothetical protein